MMKLAVDWDSALREWSAALGAGHVITDSAALTAAGTTTFAASRVIPAILRPVTRAQVQQCLRVANRYRVPLYPVSSGKNWGYGSAAPARTQTAILDLSRMNRIVGFDEKLAYITVEPGVTQRQVLEFLQQKKSALWMDSTGSSPHASLIGNTIERGFGHTPYGDHFAHCCGLEVVLPTAECIQTGFSRFPNAHTGPLYRWGSGPSLDGLFSQSNFGIVTRMSIWLMPAPEHFQAFFFRCGDERHLPAIVDALARLRLSETLRSTVHIGNDYKVLAGLIPYPWDAADGKTPLTPEVMTELRHKYKIGVWSGSGGLYGTKRQVAEARRLVREALKGKADRVTFLDDRLLALSLRYRKPVKLLTGWDLSQLIGILQPLYGLLKGIPTSQPMQSAYWRKKAPAPPDMDPDRDGCGLLWFAPILPADGEKVNEVRAAVAETMLAAGFEPMISLSLITGRAIACVISLSFDRAIPGEDQRAMACYQSLVARINAMGYYSYRLGIQSMAEMDTRDSYGELLLRLKNSFDPAGILAPGRYQPPARDEAGSSGAP